MNHRQLSHMLPNHLYHAFPMYRCFAVTVLHCDVRIWSLGPKIDIIELVIFDVILLKGASPQKDDPKSAIPEVIQ